MIDTTGKNGMYLLTGSQKFELMKGVSESLAGRISIVNMLGLSTREICFDDFNKPFVPTSEYLLSRNTKINLTGQELWKRIHRGSMPKLYDQPDMDWEGYYSNYVNTYLERDVHQLEQVGDSLQFLQFMTALAGRTGELLNMNSIAKDIGVSAPTIKKWISILQKSNIVFLLQPFSVNVNKRVIKTPKVYFYDTGLVAYLCRWLTPEALMNGAISGNIFETYVVSEIAKSYFNAGKQPNIYFFRDINGAEIDLLIYENGVLHPLEIKKSALQNSNDIRHFKTLASHFPNAKIGEGGLICNYSDILPLAEGQKIIPVKFI